MPRPAIILFAHGARDPEWARPFEKIRQLVTQRMPGARVELAFLDFMQPTLPQAAAALAADGIGQATVVPLFMSQGGHLKEDLPRLLAEISRRHPALVLRAAPASGEAEAVLAAISAWACDVHQAPRKG